MEQTASGTTSDLPLPATTPGDVGTLTERREYLEAPRQSRVSKSDGAEADLLPARDPPRYSYFDFFPFSLLINFLTKRGKKVKGKKAALLRAKLHHHSSTQNLPLEISLYIVSFPLDEWSLSSLNDSPELIHRCASKPQSH
jgi:hypothetical protein